MKILFFGDSITDASRDRNSNNRPNSYGTGYVRYIAGRLLYENPDDYEIVNRGVSGDRVVDLYARVKRDVWNLNPDVLSIFIGINDVWHEIDHDNGVDLQRYEKIYRMLIEDTLKVLPNVKMMIVEPCVLKGTATESNDAQPDRWQRFTEVYKYAEVARKIAKDYNIPFVELQKDLSALAEKHCAEKYLADGVHPNVAGASLIGENWIKVFKKEIIK